MRRGQTEAFAWLIVPRGIFGTLLHGAEVTDGAQTGEREFLWITPWGGGCLQRRLEQQLKLNYPPHLSGRIN